MQSYFPGKPSLICLTCSRGDILGAEAEDLCCRSYSSVRSIASTSCCQNREVAPPAVLGELKAFHPPLVKMWHLF